MLCLCTTVQHEANGGDIDERLRGLHSEFVVFTQSSITPEPSKTALHDPGQACDLERSLAALNDLKRPTILLHEMLRKLPALVAGIGDDGANIGEQRT